MNKPISGSRLQIVLVCLTFIAGTASASEPEQSLSTDGIPNYIDYSETFSSSGQPPEDYFPLLARLGFEQVIYIALTTNRTAVAQEDVRVLENGMDYVHVPVDFSNPSLKNFNTVAAILNGSKGRKTLLYCQANYRASTFSFLYRVIHLGVPVDVAIQDLHKIWMPNPVWKKFLVDTLAANGKSYNCETCE